MSLKEWEKVLDEIEANRVYERIPEGNPYGTLDALLKAEIGATTEESRRDVALRGWGGDRKSKEFNDQVKDINLMPANQTGPTKEYLAARIARDHPDIKAQLDAGAFHSVRQAALKAGIVEPSFQCPKDPEKAARRLKRHFDGDQLKQLIDLLTR